MIRPCQALKNFLLERPFERPSAKLRDILNTAEGKTILTVIPEDFLMQEGSLGSSYNLTRRSSHSAQYLQSSIQ